MIVTYSLLVKFREMKGQEKYFDVIEISLFEKFHYKNVYASEFCKIVRKI